ncbi:MAG: endonuclease III, partial [Betaproteobacteria bacterium]|nr:endonuclease III [Betaproteobacteria bacterium]
MNAEKRIEIFRRLHAINPNPTTELEYRTPFELLVAVLLSAQATDVSVNAATRKLFPKANTPQKIAKLGVVGVTPFIKTIGLYRTKAKHLIKTCELLLAHHGGAVPEHREALEALPGVGRKTANVVLNTAFGWESIAVDTHIFRVANRTKIGPGKTVMEVEKRLERLVPSAYKRNAHHWL